MEIKIKKIIVMKMLLYNVEYAEWELLMPYGSRELYAYVYVPIQSI